MVAAVAIARQLALTGEWEPRECRGHYHDGPRLLPLEHFARNGHLRRNTCNTCRARIEAERASAAEANNSRQRQFLARVARLWLAPARLTRRHS